MSWNYRVVKTDQGYSVYEVFYDDAGKPITTTQNPTLDFFCDTPEDVHYELGIIARAFDSPPLDMKDIGTPE